jgi:hypothetical protein
MKKRYPNIKKVVNKLIDDGRFIVKDNEIIFIIDSPRNYRYIYKIRDDLYRVMITDPENSEKKIHVGYYNTLKEAINARDSFLAILNNPRMRSKFYEKYLDISKMREKISKS